MNPYEIGADIVGIWGEQMLMKSQSIVRILVTLSLATTVFEDSP